MLVWQRSLRSDLDDGVEYFNGHARHGMADATLVALAANCTRLIHLDLSGSPGPPIQTTERYKKRCWGVGACHSLNLQSPIRLEPAVRTSLT
jgi:hypothetical protein